MPATLSPPASAPGSVNLVEGAPPKPPPAPTTMIRVSEMTPPPVDPGPKTEIKKGSALDRLNDTLRKKAGSVETPAPEPKSTPAKAKASPPETPAQTAPAKEAGQDLTPEPASAETPQVPGAPATDPKKEKANPWKMVDEWKGRAAKLEKDFVELKKQIVPEQERKSMETRIQQAEAKVKQYEEEIRYVNFQKHPDYIKNFQQPYEQAWKAATAELSEISIRDPQTQEPRAATAQDLLELVSLPLGKAREIADQVFGCFADDVMGHRKEIKALFERKQNAEKEAREGASLHQQQQNEQAQRQATEISTHIKETWEKTSAAALEDPKYGSEFKPREGDQEWNQRLGKGFQLVDQAYSENPTDPRLTPEQRAAAIKRHVAVRNRAASWGAIKFERDTLKARVEQLEKDLAAYKDTEPPAGGTAPGGNVDPGGSKIESVYAAIRAKARPI